VSLLSDETKKRNCEFGHWISANYHRLGLLKMQIIDGALNDAGLTLKYSNSSYGKVKSKVFSICTYN